MKVSNFAAVLLRKLFSSNTKWWGSVDAETSRAAKQALLEFAGTEVRPASPMASDDNVPVQVLLRTSDSADHSPTRSSSWVQFLFRPGRGLSFSRWSSTAFRLVLCRINRVMQNLQAIWRCSEQKKCSQAEDPKQRELALLVFTGLSSYITPQIRAHHATLLPIFSSCLAEGNTEVTCFL